MGNITSEIPLNPPLGKGDLKGFPESFIPVPDNT